MPPTAETLLCSRVMVSMDEMPATPLPSSPTYICADTEGYCNSDQSHMRQSVQCVLLFHPIVVQLLVAVVYQACS